MTARLFDERPVRTLEDARFTARVASVEGPRVALDATLFYPTGGGQPCDLGTLGGERVVDVVEQGETIWHILERAPAWTPGQEVAGELDLARRRHHAEHHSGQHLLSAVLLGRHGVPTLSFHLGEEASTIDVPLERFDALERVEAEVNAWIRACVPVTARVHAAGDAARAAASGLRNVPEPKALASARGLRVVEIGDLDRDACCGTHVSTTGELGALLLLGATRAKKGQTRISFVAGAHAIAVARARLNALDRTGAALGCGPNELVERATGLLADAKASRKELDATRAKLADHEARALVAADACVVRLIEEGDAAWTRDLARAAARARPDARIGLVHRGPDRGPSDLTLVVARGESATVDAGAVVKALMARFGGRGGGPATQAQGAIPDATRAAELLEAVRVALGG